MDDMDDDLLQSNGFCGTSITIMIHILHAVLPDRRPELDYEP